MTNLEKIDCAVTTTLNAHPDYRGEIMIEILMKKLMDKDPFVTAKYFSRANDARAHMIEVSNLDLLSEILKNTIKVSFLMEQKGMKSISDEMYLDGRKDALLFGSTACQWLREQMEKHPNVHIDDLLEHHPEILPMFVSVFHDTRYNKNSVISIEELDNPDFLGTISLVLNRIDHDIQISI